MALPKSASAPSISFAPLADDAAPKVGLRGVRIERNRPVEVFERQIHAPVVDILRAPAGQRLHIIGSKLKGFGEIVHGLLRVLASAR